MSLKSQFRLKPHERVLMTLQRHPITFVRQIGLFLLAAGAPAAAAWQFFGGVPSFDNAWAQSALVLLAGTYYLCIWLFFFTQFVDHYLDISVVTDWRLVDVHQDGLFSRSVSELELTRVQDVTSEVKGIAGTVFNYGAVTVQSAGEGEHFTFDDVHDPHGVREGILELVHKSREREAKEMLADAVTQRD